MLQAVLEAARTEQRFREAVTGLDEETGGGPEAMAGVAGEALASSVLTVVTSALEGAGGTEVAIEIAAQLRGRDETVVLVDADLVAPNLSQRLRAPLTAVADRIVVVSDGSPAGVVRLSRWMVDALELTQPGRVHVVVNRSDSRDARGQIDAELLRTVPCAGVWHVPSDRRLGRAAWSGTFAAPGRFTRAVAAVAGGAIPRPRPRASRPCWAESVR